MKQTENTPKRRYEKSITEDSYTLYHLPEEPTERFLKAIAVALIALPKPDGDGPDRAICDLYYEMWLRDGILKAPAIYKAIVKAAQHGTVNVKLSGNVLEQVRKLSL